MDKKESIRQSFERIRMRRKAREKRVSPDAPCSKCGAHAWEPDFEGSVQDWYCFRCGNRGFWVDSSFQQTHRG